MKFVFLLLAVVLSFSTVTSVRADEGGSGHGGEDLIGRMTALQYFLHKAGLALNESNFQLADFYLHEIEETLEEVEKVKSYDGHPVGKMSAAMLGEVFRSLEEAVEKEDRRVAKKAYGKMVEACNSCHLATEHGFIKIRDKSRRNPYMQKFGE
ncbi:hypothetical protein [Candidatus Mycalebacterium sp.]